jgi:hypothetical protein
MARTNQRATAAFTYVLIGDRELPPEQQTEFVLRPMTVDEHAAAHDGLVRTVYDKDGNRTIVQRTRQQGVAIALEHIVDVHNFPVDKPQPWPEERAKRRDFLSLMMPGDVQEVAAEVMRRADVGVEEKNSSRPERTYDSGADSLTRASMTASPVGSAG